MNTLKSFLVAIAVVAPSFASAHSGIMPVVMPKVPPVTTDGGSIAIECELLLLPGLPRTETPSYDIELHEPAGFIVGKGEKLPDLDSGFYLWQVWRTNELAIVPRYDFEKFRATGQGVHTHEAFELLFLQKYGREITDEIVASGEVRVAFDEAFYLNNKSGRRRGPDATLRLGERMFKDRGARVSKFTTIDFMDRSKPENVGHSPSDRRYDEWQLGLMSVVLGQPEGPALVRLYERLGRVLRPYAHIAFDREQACEMSFPVCTVVFPDRLGGVRDLPFLMIALTRRTKFMDMMTPIQYALVHATNFDGIYYAIQSDWHMISTGQRAPEFYVKYTAPRVIEFMLAKLKRFVVEEDRDELRSIAAGFAALPERLPAVDEASQMKAVVRPDLALEAKPDVAPPHTN